MHNAYFILCREYPIIALLVILISVVDKDTIYFLKDETTTVTPDIWWHSCLVMSLNLIYLNGTPNLLAGERRWGQCLQRCLKEISVLDLKRIV